MAPGLVVAVRQVVAGRLIVPRRLIVAGQQVVAGRLVVPTRLVVAVPLLVAGRHVVARRLIMAVRQVVARRLVVAVRCEDGGRGGATTTDVAPGLVVAVRQPSKEGRPENRRC